MRLISQAFLALSCFVCQAADDIVIGQYAAKIVPEQIAFLTLPEKGTLTQIADESKPLSKGDIVACLNMRQLEEEEEELELQLQRDRITRADEMQKMRQQQKRIEFYLKLSARERAYAKEMNTQEEPSTPEALTNLQELMELSAKSGRANENKRRRDMALNRAPQTLTLHFKSRLH